jgi:hypothetical protein
MAVDYYGRTISQPQDINTAIGRRLDTINSMGDQQNQFAQQQAASAESARQAAIAARYQQSQTDAINQGSANEQQMYASQPQQTTGATGVSQYTGKPGNNYASFKNAIGLQESGNSYGSVNSGSGAMGKYQIMPSNLGGKGSGWDYEALGYDVTPAQFMASPQIQEKIANKQLQGYYNQYGPAGAAVAWYAGPNAAATYAAGQAAGTNGQAGGNPSVSSYIQQVLSKMGL